MFSTVTLDSLQEILDSNGRVPACEVRSHRLDTFLKLCETDPVAPTIPHHYNIVRLALGGIPPPRVYVRKNPLGVSKFEYTWIYDECYISVLAGALLLLPSNQEPESRPLVQRLASTPIEVLAFSSTVPWTTANIATHQMEGFGINMMAKTGVWSLPLTEG